MPKSDEELAQELRRLANCAPSGEKMTYLMLLPTWRSWGKMEQRLDNWQNAVECFSQATQLPGSDPQDFHGLGVCLSKSASRASGADRNDLSLRAKPESTDAERPWG